ncbi:hypothetical protein FQN54_007243 [Arachnomyces sp. PD_36]|nr:hypothetical protein FQN54_007243 [Arachnomyces sp. PD_36]
MRAINIRAIRYQVDKHVEIGKEGVENGARCGGIYWIVYLAGIDHVQDTIVEHAENGVGNFCGLIASVQESQNDLDLKTLVTLDVLTSVVDCLSFESLLPHLFHILGVPLPNVDHALAIKVKCFFLRADDENESHKRASDITDVKFICGMMIQSEHVIGDNCAQSFRFGYYHMFQLRFELDYQGIENFIRIGLFFAHLGRAG